MKVNTWHVKPTILRMNLETTIVDALIQLKKRNGQGSKPIPVPLWNQIEVYRFTNNVKNHFRTSKAFRSTSLFLPFWVI